MSRMRKTLPENIREIIDSGDFERFAAVFNKCEISATKRGRTTANILSYQGLTPAHIQFVIDNGLDINGDCGWSMPAAAYQSHCLDNLQCLVDNGADIDLCLDTHYGNALYRAAAVMHNPTAVANLIYFGAHTDGRFGWNENTILDEALIRCSNIDIINMVKIARMLLGAGAKITDETHSYVCKIGETFEFYRSSFDKGLVGQVSDALQELYLLFGVEPIPMRTVHDGVSPIVVTKDTWQKQYSQLWELLVPGAGAADTVQGEVIRIVGRISYEILDNGAVNWDDDYRKMVSALSTYFRMADGLDAVFIDEACAIAKSVSSHSDEYALTRLTELAVKWVVANPIPIKLGAVDYCR